MYRISESTYGFGNSGLDYPESLVAVGNYDSLTNSKGSITDSNYESENPGLDNPESLAAEVKYERLTTVKDLCYTRCII